MMTFPRIGKIALALLFAGWPAARFDHHTLTHGGIGRPCPLHGEWYEIALLPNRFQSMCVADTQASYRLDGDVVRVRNRCRNADGAIEEAVGIAKTVEGSRNAKLRVSFFRPFYGTTGFWRSIQTTGGF